MDKEEEITSRVTLNNDRGTNGISNWMPSSNKKERRHNDKVFVRCSSKMYESLIKTK